jgi:DNA-binding MarR family transcriptional regulator
MGIKMVKRAWDIENIHSTEKYVLLTLAYFGDDKTGNSWISAAEIAGHTLVSKRQVFRILKALKNRGFITNYSGVFSKSLWHLSALHKEYETVPAVANE